MNKVMYKVNNTFGVSIKAVSITRETEKSVWSGESRYVKDTGNQKFFDDFHEAKNFALGLCMQDVESAENVLKRARNVMGNIKGITIKNVEKQR